MESINISEVKHTSPFFKQGTQACVYHDKKYAYKLYKLNDKNMLMFHTMDVDYQLEKLSRINVDSYVTPKFSIKDDRGHIRGYGMDYIKGKTLNRLNMNVNINKFIDDLKKLEEDTYKISEEKYKLRDRNDRNFLYTSEDGFKLIDLDYGIFDPHKSTDEINRHNIGFIKDILIASVFGIGLFDKLGTSDHELTTCLHKNDSLTDFIEYIEKDVNKEKVLIKDIRRKKNDLIVTKNYYGHY